MKTFVATLFALTLLGTTAASADVGLGVHIGGLGAGVNLGVHGHHRHCHGWGYRHHHRYCRGWY